MRSRVVECLYDNVVCMVGKTHQLIGFASVYSAALLTGVEGINIQTFIACFILISLGSLTPDLDNEKNKIYTLVPIGQRTFSEVFERVFGKHRSVSHSFIGILILGWISHWLMYHIPLENGFNADYLWASFMIALIAHIGADMYTKDGVPLLWPLKITFYGIPFKPLRIRTGSWVEFVFVEGGVILSTAILTYILWDRVVSLVFFG